MLFLLLTVGMIDGVRVIFYYSQIQEAARQGARWGSVQVARAITAPTNGAAPTVGGTFYDPGNAPTTYTDSCSSGTSSAPVPSSPPPACYPLSSTEAITNSTTGVITPTIVGATMRATTALNPADAQIVISTTAAISDTSVLTMTENTQTDVNWFTNKPVTVTVTYPFRPLLSLIFKRLTIPLKGTSVMLHE